ncbi:MAG: globin domain-containing protein [Pirellulaceae bacterium]|jgi:hemoglobin-like flavoprotein|nr:globin domain-containing protein [Pirellulaceae bacterium]MDP7017302.1 globin domain-containing protein [Pirellulaceae bacterium]
MDLNESISDILDSNLLFGRTFYENLFALYPEAKTHFRGVNMHRQAATLTMTLLVIENYRAAERPAMTTYLRELGAQHQERGIPTEMYSPFRRVLLETLAAFHGDRWSDELSLQWSTAVDHTIKEMAKGYQPEREAE